jgi:Fur family transcriptional regulator, peroxide stress response regulator
MMTDARTGTEHAEGQPAYRKTAQRELILDVVREAADHLTAGDIFERVRQRDPRVAYGTVYRTLHMLVERGLVSEITFADQASRYDARVDRHDHVYCTTCGAIADVEVPTALIARHVAAERSGYEVTNHSTVFSGFCPACRVKRTAGGAAGSQTTA